MVDEQVNFEPEPTETTRDYNAAFDSFVDKVMSAESECKVNAKIIICLNDEGQPKIWTSNLHQYDAATLISYVAKSISAKLKDQLI